MAGIPLDRLAHLIRAQRVAGLGTLRDGFPLVTHIPYAPAPDLSALYILASAMSWHTQDFLKDHRVGMLIAEVDDGSGDPRLLMRVSLWGGVSVLPPGSFEIASARKLYLERFPEAEDTLGLSDFDFFKIVPEGARFVAGFAQAYTLTPEHLKRAGALSDSSGMQ